MYRRIHSNLRDRRACGRKSLPRIYTLYGRADRTGTLAFLINALLGVGEDDLIRDYETTTFSVYGERSRNSAIYKFADFYKQLKSYAGSTFAEKTENYMLSISVTQTQINAIKSIMLTK